MNTMEMTFWSYRIIFSFLFLTLLYFSSNYSLYDSEFDYLILNSLSIDTFHFAFFIKAFIFSLLLFIFRIRSYLLIIFISIICFDFLANGIFIPNDASHIIRNEAQNLDVFIPNLTKPNYTIANYQIFMLVSLVIYLIPKLRIWIILIPSLVMGIYTIYSKESMIKQDINVDINNSLIISLNKDAEKIKFNLKNNKFISNDYILSDILSSHTKISMNKIKYYASHYSSNGTLNNVYSKIQKNKLFFGSNDIKDVYLYIDKFATLNINHIYTMGYFDIYKNIASKHIINLIRVNKILDSNRLYKKSITRKVYISNNLNFDLFDGVVETQNQKIKINTSFIVGKKTHKISYNNKAKSPLVMIVVDEQYLILAHQKYLNTFFIQAVIFNRPPNKSISRVYDKDGVILLKVRL